MTCFIMFLRMKDVTLMVPGTCDYCLGYIKRLKIVNFDLIRYRHSDCEEKRKYSSKKISTYQYEKS